MKTLQFDEETKQKYYSIFNSFPVATKTKEGFELDCGSYCTLTFVMMQQLATMFGTEKIDVNSEVFRGGGCETCAYETSEIKIQVIDPTRNIPT